MNRLIRLVGRRYPTYLIRIPGLVALIAGLALGVSIVVRVLKVRVVPVGTTVISVSLCLAGAMCILGSLVLSTSGRLEQEIKGKRAVDAEDSAALVASPGQKGANRVLVVLGVFGLVALLAGLSWGAWAVNATFTRGSLFPGSYIGSVSSCLAGLMMILTGMTLHVLHEILREVQGTS
jgi:hypothetical protein